jgi:hypothetical protein
LKAHGGPAADQGANAVTDIILNAGVSRVPHGNIMAAQGLKDAIAALGRDKVLGGLIRVNKALIVASGVQKHKIVRGHINAGKGRNCAIYGKNCLSSGLVTGNHGEQRLHRRPAPHNYSYPIVRLRKLQPRKITSNGSSYVAKNLVILRVAHDRNRII